MTDKAIIDFTELVSAVPGEGLEQLARQLALRKNLRPLWSGRGADRGLDLLFTEILSGPLSGEKVTWLVSCKDKAKSGDSVNERDLGSVRDKLAQHKANGFLLVTTTAVSTGAKDLLDSLDKSQGGEYHTLVWDSSDLSVFLLDPSNQPLLQQFLPQSYQRVRGLPSFEAAITVLAEKLPSAVFDQIIKLIRPYASEPSEATEPPTGSQIWPYDAAAAGVIDQIVSKLFDQADTSAAAAATDEIDYDAWIALVETLHDAFPARCLAYLTALACDHHDPDLRLNAVQFVFDNYEPNPDTRMQLASCLDADGLDLLYNADIASFVETEVMSNAADYELYSDLDLLSSATAIDDVSIDDLTMQGTRNGRVEFEGNMSVSVTFYFEQEAMGSQTFPGRFSGYFDASGMYLESATVDVRSYYDGAD